MPAPPDAQMPLKTADSFLFRCVRDSIGVANLAASQGKYEIDEKKEDEKHRPYHWSQSACYSRAISLAAD